MSLLDKWNGILDEIINQCKSVSGLGDTLSNNGFNATTATMPTGTLRAVTFASLQPGDFIDSFNLEVNVASGNVRIKIYDDLSGTPGALLGESAVIPISKIGSVNIRLDKQVEVPIDGIVWVAFENDNALLDIDISTGQSSGSIYTVAHTFGSGPDPFGVGSAGTDPFFVELHINPVVVKHYGIRGTQAENYFAIVGAGEMTADNFTNRGSLNTFKIMVDLSYKGVDFQNGLTKNLFVASAIYDKIHLTTLNDLVRRAIVEIFPEEILEGERLYLIGTRIVITCERHIIQPI